MTKVTNDLIYEVLKQMQSDLSTVKHDIGELKEGQMRLREDVHSLSGRVLQVERSLFSLDERLLRVERRLDLVTV